MRIQINKCLSLVFCLLSTSAFAALYPAPKADEALIGQINYTTATDNDTVVTIAKRYNLGFNALQQANPHVNVSKPFSSGTPLILPTEHLLPNQAREGIVVNLPEMRLYYYVSKDKLLTYPIGIGKIGTTIPIVKATITRKAEKPTWVPTENIRQFNLKQGIILPQYMPAGPDNPLGDYAVYMTIPTYLMHSTIFPESIGKRASFGCIRMYVSDIQEFFPTVKTGIPIIILNEPVKIGFQHQTLYMEAHPALEEHDKQIETTLPGIVNRIHQTAGLTTLVDWQAVTYINQERDGMPHDIGIPISN